MFNRSNYETVCFYQEGGNEVSTFLNVPQSTISSEKFFSHYFFYTDYKGELTKCSGFYINPKCICAYEMYAKGIFDICKNIAPNENGSLDHVDGKINSAYSLVENFP